MLSSRTTLVFLLCVLCPVDFELGRLATVQGQEPTAANTGSPARQWRQSETTLALIQGDHVVWQFNYGPDLTTTYFHPVGTAGGQVLSWDRPADHAWHHGVWFNWKYINGVNYWEHNGRTGKPDGQTEWFRVQLERRDDHSARISLALAYHPVDNEEVVLRERRQIEISAPDASGAYHMDWTCNFVAGDGEVKLDRTPPQEQSWGGYAGLSVRFAKDLTERQAISTLGPAEFGAGDRYRGNAPAMDYSGMVDGQAVGLAFLDHPGNPRHPTPWYVIRSPVMGYINAALLANEPLTLQPREQLTLRYRLVVHADRWDAERLQAAHERFMESN